MKRTGLILFLAIASARAEENRFEIYPLGLADGAPIELMARSIVGDDGTVTLDTRNQRLLVMATDDEHRKIADVVGKAAIAPRNVRIEVSFAGAQSSREREASVSGNVGVQREDGVTRTRWKIQPRVVDRTVIENANARQQLLVASGREGRLLVGEQLPYLTWLIDYGIQHGVIREQLQWRDVGSFLIVEPTVIGDGPLIRVRVIPELSGTVNGAPWRTRYAGVATEVTVSDGETVTIGASDRNRDFYERFLIGVRSGGAAERQTITLTPRIQSMPRPGVTTNAAAGPAVEGPGQRRIVPISLP